MKSESGKVRVLEIERELEVWYIALARRQAWCFADCSVREREMATERERGK